MAGTAAVRRAVDVVVLGGGAMGSSVAHWLGRLDPTITVAVIERDTSYTLASSALSVGSLRNHFSLEANIKMSQFGLGFIRDELQLPFDEGGYAFLAPPGPGGDVLRENAALQQSLGADIHLLDNVNAVKQEFPWLNTDGVAVATVGRSGEGWFDPYLLTTSLKKSAEGLGAQFVRGNVVGIDSDDGDAVRSVTVAGEGGVVHEITCGAAVVAGGCWSAGMVEMALRGRRNGAAVAPVEQLMPVAPRKRQVFVFECAEVVDPPVPLLVDISGFYVRRDGPVSRKSFLCGGMEGTVSEDPDCKGVAADLEVNHDYFYEELWPRLAHRIPAFEAIKVTAQWAGFYDYNRWDQNALLGHIPGFSNLFSVTGFSGHGVQQAPSAGLAIAELITHGEYKTQPDLTVFDVSRVADGVKVLERNIV